MSEIKKQKTFDPSISLIKLLAMFLIIQSHADKLFPTNIAFLATGGALGNELFFLVGGALYSAKKDIVETTYKRFIRLYVPTYIMTSILYIFGVIPINDLNTVKEIVYRLIWPTSFWFVSAFFFDGIILHLLINQDVFINKRKLLCLSMFYILSSVLVYILCVSPKNIWIVEDFKFFDGMLYYKCFYSFFVFCLGFFLKENQKKYADMVKPTYAALIALLSFFCFYGFKLLLNKGIVPMDLQILSQAITVICVVYIYLWITNTSSIKRWLLKSEKRSSAINKLGSITLESFLVQFELIGAISTLKIPFPINYIFAIITIVLAAYIFKAIDQKICDYIVNKL